LIIHITWVCDTIQYLFVNNLKCPVVLWAVPFIETFSLACVQHFGSILWESGINYKHVYGMPEEKEIVSAVDSFASTAKIAKDLKKSRIALIGPRQTWRVANAQDMTREEWDLSKTLGITIVHIEMDELISSAEKHSSKDANKILHYMKQKNRIGKVEIDDERLLYAAKVYLGVKELFERYGLTAASAECYPKYGGLVNLPSSWLADEGIILDTEGDVGHATLLTTLYQMGKVGPAALSEVGSIDFKDNCLYLDHEGSSAHSLAEDVSKVHIGECGEGTMVGFPFKPLSEVTITDICGNNGNYKVLIIKGSTHKIDNRVWVDADRKLLVKVKFDRDAKEVFDNMLYEGIDHHLLIKEGDLTSQLSDFCDLLKTKKVCL
jgi:L-arabinose isomerase